MKYEFRNAPYEHQRAALQKGWRQPGFAYLMEYGTGKSKCAIDNMAILHRVAGVDAVIIVAGKGSYSDWVLPRGPEDLPHIEKDLSTEIFAATHIHLWRGSSSKGEQQKIDFFLTSTAKLKIFVVNIEALSRTRNAFLVADSILAKANSSMMIVDEATSIKHEDSLRSKTLMSLRDRNHVAYRRILTGGPITNNLMDLWSQFEFLEHGCLGFTNFFAFRNRYCVMAKIRTGRTEKDENGEWRHVKVDTIAVDDQGRKKYRNIPDLSKRLERISFRCLKRDCLDLPEKVWTRVHVEMTKEQRDAYNAMRDDCFVELEGKAISATVVLAQLTKLHQICCGFINSSEGIVRLKHNRLDVLMEQLAEVDCAVIWGNYLQNIDDICLAIAAEYGDDFVRYDGTVSDADRDQGKYDFQAGKKRFFVGTTASGGAALQLVAASTTFYFSNSYDLSHRLNSEDRIHRIGQTKRCTYVDLMIANTVDDKIVNALRHNIDIASVVLQDGYKQWLI